MQREFDLLAIDLDGTLLRRDGTVSSRNLAAIREARDAGIEVIIATGRAWIESAHVLAALGFDGVFIGAGGALLAESRTGHTIERSAMDPSLVRRISESILSHGRLVHLLKDRAVAGYDYVIVGKGVLDPATRWWFDTLPIEVRYIDLLRDDEHPDDTLRVGTVSPASITGRLADEIAEDLGESVFLQHWEAVTALEGRPSEPTHLLEVFNPDTDKWTMLLQHGRRRGIDAGRIAAVGDGLNDIRMVRQAGLGIAVGNADPGVIHVAERVVADHESDGVAEAIEIILRAKGGRKSGNGDWGPGSRGTRDQGLGNSP